MWLAAFGIGPSVTWSTAAELEGTPLDRNVYTALLLLGILVLVTRRNQVLCLLRASPFLVVFFLFTATSVLWSDYPWVACKRWLKSVNDVVLVLIVLTDPNPIAAIKKLLTRASFLIIPLSILVIKYYPEIGVKYGHFEGKRVIIGLTNDKNALGGICMVFGVGFLWRFIAAYKDRGNRQRVRQLITHATLLVMTAWLFRHANSMTALLCFILVSVLVVATSLSRLMRRPVAVTFLVLGALTIVALPLFSNIGGGVFETVGRDATLTGRTNIWSETLARVANPVLGAGFESFWLAETLDEGRSFHLNEAHNGYLEVYLNLGWIGVVLVALIIAFAYRNVLSMLKKAPDIGVLLFAYWVICVTYSMTEAGFRMMNLAWICFLLTTLAAPKHLLPKIAVPGRLQSDPRGVCVNGLTKGRVHRSWRCAPGPDRGSTDNSVVQTISVSRSASLQRPLRNRQAVTPSRQK